jgi:hypothetical protein
VWCKLCKGRIILLLLLLLLSDGRNPQLFPLLKGVNSASVSNYRPIYILNIQNSSFGIATTYVGAWCPRHRGSNPGGRCGDLSILRTVLAGSRAHTIICSIGTAGSFPGSKSGRCVKLTTRYRLRQKLWMNVAVPSLPRTPSWHTSDATSLILYVTKWRCPFPHAFTDYVYINTGLHPININ